MMKNKHERETKIEDIHLDNLVRCLKPQNKFKKQGFGIIWLSKPYMSCVYPTRKNTHLKGACLYSEKVKRYPSLECLVSYNYNAFY